jgi:hypothetical protein
MSTISHSAVSPPSRDEVAKSLADSHREMDPGITLIYHLIAPEREGDPTEPVKLLEVNQSSTASGILPVYFAPHPATGICYPSIVVELHPSEWEQLQSGQIALPNGWRLDKQL